MGAPDRSAFQNLIPEVKLALLALDSVTNRDTTSSIGAAVTLGRNASALLLRHQISVKMTPEEAHQVRTAMDMILARLKFFGGAVDPH